MPQIVVCKGCGYEFYRGIELKPPEEIIERNGGVCPKCGKKLLFKIEDVEIIPIEEK